MNGVEYDMKRILCLVAVIAITGAFLGGCDSRMNSTYLSVTPHDAFLQQTDDDVVRISTYKQMRDHLAQMVESGVTGGSMTLFGMDADTAKSYMNIAVGYLQAKDPFCAYAVKQISFDVAAGSDGSTVAYQVEYHHSRSDVLRVRKVGTVEDAEKVIYAELDDFGTSVVLYIEEYAETDFTKLVHNYAGKNPDIIMETPKVNVTLYPDSGSERVAVFNFTYQNDRATLLDMRERVEQVFLSADLYIEDARQVQEVYSRLYSFLMKRYQYTVETSDTPSYSLLLSGVGDSAAFANVYAAMCRRAGLDCKVIYGSKNGAPWSWNVVPVGGVNYHVDLLECENNGQFQLLPASQMLGYEWGAV